MRILVSTSLFSPYISGLTLTADRLARALSRRKNDVTVLTNDHMFGTTYQKDPDMKIIRARPNYKISKGFLSLDFVIKSFELTRDTDFLIINLPQVEGLWVAIFAKLFRKKVISIYTCDVVLRNKLLQVLLYLFNWLVLLLSDKIVTYTHDNMENMKILTPLKGRVVSIFPPIPDLQIDTALTNKLRASVGKTKFVIGVAARLAEEKGLEYIIEALSYLPETKLLIAGPENPIGEKNYRNKILGYLEKYKGRVIFCGSIKPEDMGAFYEAIDVLVVGSVNTTEAFGLVQIEAMKQGVPVVATDLPGVRVPVLLTGMGLIVKPRNSKQLALGIKSILDKKLNYSRSKIDLFKTFSPEEIAKRYEEEFLA